jgi:hypothetical protein
LRSARQCQNEAALQNTPGRDWTPDSPWPHTSASGQMTPAADRHLSPASIRSGHKRSRELNGEHDTAVDSESEPHTKVSQTGSQAPGGHYQVLPQKVQHKQDHLPYRGQRERQVKDGGGGVAQQPTRK